MSLTSVIRYVRALDSSATDGSGKTALAFGDITAKYLTQGGTLTSLTTETITTLGTYQAPTDAAHIRIKELSSSDPCKGVYEVHFHNTQVAASGQKLWLFLSASGAAFQPLELDLLEHDVTSINQISTSAVTTVAANVGTTQPVNFHGTSTTAYVKSDLVEWLETAPLALSSQQVQGIVPDTQKVDVNTIKTQAITCSAGVTVGAFVGNATHALVVDSSGFVTVVTNNDKTGYSLSQAFPSNFSALAITAGGVAKADLQTIKTQTVTCSGGVTIPAATLASTTNIASGSVDANVATVADSAAQKIAAILLRYTASNIEGNGSGDTLDKDSLYGLMRQIQHSVVVGSTLTIHKADGTTSLGTRSVTSSAGADPITGVG